MPVYIYEKDAFRKMVAVEGKGSKELEGDFVRWQNDLGDSNQCTFFAFFKKWQTIYATDPNFIDLPEFSLDVDGSGAIYGWGGWNRYIVRSSGEIIFQEATGTQESITLAKEQGFRTWP